MRNIELTLFSMILSKTIVFVSLSLSLRNGYFRWQFDYLVAISLPTNESIWLNSDETVNCFTDYMWFAVSTQEQVLKKDMLKILHVTYIRSISHMYQSA